MEIPVPAQPHVARKRLLDRLAEGAMPGKRLTVLRAGAGTGKTTLLADYARMFPGTVCWLGLSQAEQDVPRFIAKLGDCLRTRLPALPSGGGASAVAAAEAVCLGLRTSTEEPLALILDDCQHLSHSSESLGSLELLARCLPARAQLVLAGRSLPPLKLAALWIRGELVSLEEEELAFTESEIGLWLAGASGADPPPGLAACVHRRTRGWATAVRFAGVAGGDPLQALDCPRELYAYFEQEVLSDLRSDFARRLVKCGFLADIDERLCRRVFGKSTSAFLEQLDQLGFLVTRTGERFALHPLFREFLKDAFLAETSPSERNAHLARLAPAIRTPAERVTLLLEGEAWEQAEVALVEAIQDLCLGGGPESVRSFMDRFPLSWRESSPILAYVEGALLRYEGRLDQAIALLRGAEARAKAGRGRMAQGYVWAGLAHAYAAKGDLGEQGRYAELGLGALPPEAAAARSVCLNIRGLWHRGRREFAAAAADFEQVRTLARGAGRPAAEAVALHNLGHVLAEEGDLATACLRYRESIAVARAAGGDPLALTFANLALCLLDLGRPTECWEAIQEGMALAAGPHSERDRSYLHWAMGQLWSEEGDHQRAREALETALAEARACGDRQAETQAHMGLTDVAIACGDLPEAQRQIGLAVSAAGTRLEAPELLPAATLLADIALRQGELERAGSLLAHVERGLGRAPNPLHECQVERLSAAFQRLSGDEEAAAAHLRRMRDMAERHGLPVPQEWPAPRSSVDPRLIAHLEVHALGGFEVRVGERQVTRSQWGSSRTRLALVYLLAEPAGATREELAEILFPDQDVSRSAVHTVISRLRQALEPGAQPSRLVLLADGRYRLNPEAPIFFDAAELKRLLRMADIPNVAARHRRAWLEDAVRLYRGPFLGEFQDIQWCRVEAEAIRRAMQQAFEDLYRLAAAEQDWEALERYADQALRCNIACRHAPLRVKMVALAMLRRPQDAQEVARIATAGSCVCDASQVADTRRLADHIRTAGLSAKEALSLLTGHLG